jgi:hypothetical protein
VYQILETQAGKDVAHLNNGTEEYFGTPKESWIIQGSARESREVVGRGIFNLAEVTP